MQEKREQLMRLPLQTLLRLPLECLVKLLYSLSLLLRRSHLLLRLPDLAIRSILLGLLGLIFLVADDVVDRFVLELSQLSLFFLLLFLRFLRGWEGRVRAAVEYGVGRLRLWRGRLGLR